MSEDLCVEIDAVRGEVDFESKYCIENRCDGVAVRQMLHDFDSVTVGVKFARDGLGICSVVVKASG